MIYLRTSQCLRRRHSEWRGEPKSASETRIPTISTSCNSCPFKDVSTIPWCDIHKTSSQLLKTYVLQRLQLFFFHVFFQSFVERTFNSKEFQCFRCHEVVIMNPLQLMDLRDDVQLKDYGRVTLVDWSTRRPSDLKDLGWGFIQEKLSCKKLFLLQVSPQIALA